MQLAFPSYMPTRTQARLFDYSQSLLDWSQRTLPYFATTPDIARSKWLNREQRIDAHRDRCRAANWDIKMQFAAVKDKWSVRLQQAASYI